MRYGPRVATIVNPDTLAPPRGYSNGMILGGQRVLFVAEKMAALSVVRRRLEADGLGPWCLELHSAKASKKEVLLQLEAGLRASPGGPPAKWESLCAELAATRHGLNSYVRDMHQPRASGESLYRVLGRLTTLGDGPRINLPMDDPGTVESATLQAWGEFKADTPNVAKLGELNAEAVKLMDRAGWK